jgi:hypothetical protein
MADTSWHLGSVGRLDHWGAVQIIDSPHVDADRAFHFGTSFIRGTRTDGDGYRARCIVRERWAELEAEARRG